MQVDLREDLPAGVSVDSVLAVNVLEHILDDVGALRRMAAVVASGGDIVLFVPAYPSLYGPHDRAAGHVRRYVPASLRAAVVAAGLKVELLHPVNFLGGIAWWVAVRVGGCPARSGLVNRTTDSWCRWFASWSGGGGRRSVSRSSASPACRTDRVPSHQARRIGDAGSRAG
jgi:hypothetical protein